MSEKYRKYSLFQTNNNSNDITLDKLNQTSQYLKNYKPKTRSNTHFIQNKTPFIQSGKLIQKIHKNDFKNRTNIQLLFEKNTNDKTKFPESFLFVETYNFGFKNLEENNIANLIQNQHQNYHKSQKQNYQIQKQNYHKSQKIHKKQLDKTNQKENLTKSNFPVLQYTINQLVQLSCQILCETGFAHQNIPSYKIKGLIEIIASKYNITAYHNFSHAFSLMQVNFVYLKFNFSYSIIV